MPLDMRLSIGQPAFGLLWDEPGWRGQRVPQLCPLWRSAGVLSGATR
jgi:hypothetical protein